MNLVFAVHGFLGNGSDWNEVFKNLPKNITVCAPSLFEKSRKLTIDELIKTVHTMTENAHFVKRIFIGYSLGGRLGLQILNNQSDLFDHYIFVSTHSGLSNENDKQVRLKSDLRWKQKVVNDNWSSFLQEWNSQEVFKNSKAENRIESDFDKNLLGNALDQFSLGRQDNFENLIKLHQDKITWVVGMDDTKFCSLADALKRKKTLFDLKRVFSGHRILFDNPLGLKTILLELLQS